MVSQFTSPHDVVLLGNLDFHFPEGTHAIGRLDNHSEGLLILTTNKKITRLLFQSAAPHKRVYLVQVNNLVSQEALIRLRSGVAIRIKGGENYTTQPCDVLIISKPEELYIYDNGIVEHMPFTWLQISLNEGKYHQVRKMVAAVRHRCKRLIRISIDDVKLSNLKPGEVHEISEKELCMKLKIIL